MTAAAPTLDRAALGGEEGYRWIHAVGLAYCLVVGFFAVHAWIIEGEPFKAAICAGAQVLSIVCAILARRAFTGRMPWMGTIATVFAAGCAWWAAQGIAHAWSANGAPANPVMVFFLAALEPALFLIAEHVEEGRRTIRAAGRLAAERAAESRLAEQRLAEIRAQAEAAPPPPPAPAAHAPQARPLTRSPGRSRLRVVSEVAMGVAAMATAGGHAEAALVNPAGQQAIDLQAREHIVAGGVRVRNELLRRTPGLTKTRAERLLDELAPGWREKRAA